MRNVQRYIGALRAFNSFVERGKHVVAVIAQSHGCARCAAIARRDHCVGGIAGRRNAHVYTDADSAGLAGGSNCIDGIDAIGCVG